MITGTMAATEDEWDNKDLRDYMDLRDCKDSRDCKGNRDNKLAYWFADWWSTRLAG